MKLIEVPIAFLAFLGALGFFMGSLYAARWINQYEVSKDALRIKLFGVITLRRIKLQDVEEVKLISAWTDTLPLSKNFQSEFLMAERWPSYVFQKKGVVLRKKTGLSRVLILSPKNPQQFVDSLFQRERSAGR